MYQMLHLVIVEQRNYCRELVIKKEILNYMIQGRMTGMYPTSYEL